MIGDGSCWTKQELTRAGADVAKCGIRETAPRYCLVAAELLERAARKLRANQSMEQVAGDLLPILEVMARRI